MKTINLLFLIIFLFQSTPTFSMNKDEEKTSISKIKLSAGKENQKDTDRSDDDCCTHWGIKHWVYGIKEYIIDRCMCCAMYGFNPIDEDRAYRDDNDNITTDCCCLGVSSCCVEKVFNNPIGGTLCFPLATTMHILCLPLACCSPRKDGGYTIHIQKKEEYKSSYSGGGTYYSSYGGKTESYSPYSGKTESYSPYSGKGLSDIMNSMTERAAWNNFYNYSNPSSPLYRGY